MAVKADRGRQKRPSGIPGSPALVPEMRIYDLRSRTDRVLTDRAGFPYAWSPDGKRIAAAGQDGEHGAVFVRRFELRTGRQYESVRLRGSSLQNLVWLPQSSLLAVTVSGESTGGAHEQGIYICGTGRPFCLSHSDAIGLSVVGRRLSWLTLARQGTRIRIGEWDPRTGKIRLRRPLIPVLVAGDKEAKESYRVESASLSPDGRRVAIVVDRIGFHDGRPSVDHMDITVARTDGRHVRQIVWHSEHGRRNGKFRVAAVCWSKDGRSLAVAGDRDTSPAGASNRGRVSYQRMIGIYGVMSRRLRVLAP